MTARDVATEICITTSWGTPIRDKKWYNTGTTIIPPPTPNNPAIKPEIIPDNDITKAKGINEKRSLLIKQPDFEKK